MTIQTRATVTRSAETGEWASIAYAYDDSLSALDPASVIIQMRENRQSWPEAMQAAQVMLRDVEQTLSDEVNAERLTRRVERIVTISEATA